MISPPAKLRRKPNLIVFLPDQQRADTIACYGGEKVHAPNLNKLASESVVFSRAYVTHPVCTPSRCSLMTGMWPHTTGCTKNSVALAPRFSVLPQLLEDKDYRAAYMGKWHLGQAGFPQRGFDEWISTDQAGHYSRFLVSMGLTPDREDGGFSELAISNLPLELSRPKFLEKHAKVARVFYPGLPSHPDHKLAKRQMRGFGSMLAFDMKGGLPAARRVCDRVRLFLLAASLGGVESLVVLPAYTSHYNMSPEELKRGGVTPGMVRVSIGIEDAEDLIADLQQALA